MYVINTGEINARARWRASKRYDVKLNPNGDKRMKKRGEDKGNRDSDRSEEQRRPLNVDWVV